MNQKHEIVLEGNLRRTLAKFSGLCGALLAAPLCYARNPDQWFLGGIFGLVFGWSLGLCNQAVAALIILASAAYWAKQLGLFH